MSNILAVVCYRRLTRKPRVGPFFIGFVFSGAMAILVWFNFWLMADEGWLASTLLRISLDLVRNLEYYTSNNSIIIAVHHVVFNLAFILSGTLPQMMVAIAGGWIARRYVAKTSTTSPGSQPPG